MPMAKPLVDGHKRIIDSGTAWSSKRLRQDADIHSSLELRVGKSPPMRLMYCLGHE